MASTLICLFFFWFALTSIFLRTGVRVSRNGVAAGDGDGDGELESAICQTCAPILGLSVVDLDVPLIELGLNSIQALRLKERLEQQIPDAEIEIADMLDGITLREILERVRNGRGAEQVKKPKDTPVEKDKVAQAAGKPYSGAKERTPGWSWELVDPDKRRGLEHHYVQVGNCKVTFNLFLLQQGTALMCVTLMGSRLVTTRRCTWLWLEGCPSPADPSRCS